jgi:hypothetical protein
MRTVSPGSDHAAHDEQQHCTLLVNWQEIPAGPGDFHHDGARFYTGGEGTKPGSESMQDSRNPVATIPRAAIGGSNRSHGLNISSHRWEKVLTRRLEFTAGEAAAAEQLGRATRGSRLVYAARRGENSGKVAPQRPCVGSGGDFVGGVEEISPSTGGSTCHTHGLAFPAK